MGADLHLIEKKQPLPKESLEALVPFLEGIIAGDIQSFAIAAINRDGLASTGFYTADKASALVGAVEWLKLRIIDNWE